MLSSRLKTPSSTARPAQRPAPCPSPRPSPSGFSLRNRLLEFVWPTRCVGCEKHGALLCGACAEELSPIDIHTACPRCGAPHGSLICTECYTRTGPVELNFSAAVCALSFNEIAARLIVCYKDQGERRLAELLASLIVDALPLSWGTWADVLMFIPAGQKAQRRRGFDHMEEVALKIAETLKLPLWDALEKLPAADQRGLNRSQRYENLIRAFAVTAEASALACTISPPRNILLIDDVLTTGATLDAAAAVLKTQGAQEVRVATVARVW